MNVTYQIQGMRRLWAGLCLGGLLLGSSAVATAENGRLKVLYAPAKSTEYQDWHQGMKEEKTLEALADSLNEIFILPEDITISLAECGVVNAFYESAKQRITLCYELMDDIYNRFEADAKNSEEEVTEEEIEDAMVGATLFVFYHELGHALVDVLALPVTGREEDVADQLSALILADGTEEGEKAVLDGAQFFTLDFNQGDEATDNTELAFWDEHSLSEQRFYNLVCWIYGQNPEEHSDFVGDDWLPAERASRCSGEWELLERSWLTLLEPHLQEGVNLGRDAAEDTEADSAESEEESEEEVEDEDSAADSTDTSRNSNNNRSLGQDVPRDNGVSR